MPNLYRVSLLYESKAPIQRDSAMTDFPCEIGTLFYGRWGRAIVTKCVRAEGNIKPANAEYPQLRKTT